ncbi:MAG TPA: conjugal transfer protein TrbF [Amphiplicatus sp.]|mgnify:FL=1|nr:conjugal transfer protein TrbF [Amphiplicatus sp.]MCB9956163.1 conjugal transfer protein TrbF [Caulobacterales bacterium]HOP18460.1 conjugal transfer protein TrbF [Amphiplicatus sp.]
MLFKRASAAYGETPEPETPFQKAGQIWDERIGSARAQAANWRFMAFGCLALAVGASAGLVWRSLQSTVTPYVVEVDELGAVQAVGPASLRYNPTDAQIAHHLARFLENVRGLSVDPIVVRQNWLSGYDFTTDKGAAVLNDYARDNDPFESVGHRSRTVDVVSVVRVSDDTFQARWIERAFENSAFTKTERFTALMTIVIDPPRDAATLRKNPLGIFIHGLNWSEDLDTGEKQ